MTKEETRELINQRLSELNISKLPEELTRVRLEISDLKGDIKELREELKGDMKELREELKGDIKELKGDIKTVSGRVDILLRVMYFIGASLFAGLVKYLFFS